MSRKPSNTVVLTVPCAPEYVAVARLAMLGIASRKGFSYESVEDIRLAVAEVCSNAISRNESAGSDTDSLLTISAWDDGPSLCIEIEDNLGDLPAPDETAVTDSESVDEAELGELLIELLMDEVDTEPTPQGTRVRLVKFKDSHSPGMPNGSE
ncbi:MAG: hypothetical protein OHK0029_33510 [Armatimonadaceae bacterium]